MSPMEFFSEHMNEAIEHKASGEVTSFASQYTVYVVITLVVIAIIMVLAAKKASIIPQGRFFGGIEQLAAWFRDNVGRSTIGEGSDKHMPFLATVFFFILTANVIGLIPGASAATGIIGVTSALAVMSFVYFNYQGCKAHGTFKYLKSFAPAGLPFPVNALVWVLEVISCFLRPVTLAVRLFANMYGGHLILGAFAILVSAFTMPLIQSFSAAALGTAAASIAWMLMLIAMYALETMVAGIQAYVFTLLSAVYIQLATSESH